MFMTLGGRMPQKSDYMISRRSFVGGVVGLVGTIISAVIGLPVIGYVVSPALKKSKGEEWITLGPMSALEKGIPAPFTFSQMKEIGWRRARISQTVYAVTNDGQNVLVFSDACTHLSCKVHWEQGRDAFVCPCHDGVFDKEGNVVSGPPPKPLVQFETQVESDQLMILVET
jgi:menaquinol-cytochrome c reductase iron-sulfur subunit